MIAFPSMLYEPARRAGIPVPPPPEEGGPDPGKEGFMDDPVLRKDYLRFWIYLFVQLGRSMPSPTSHWDNAKIIAAIPEWQLTTVSYKELLAGGIE